MNAALKTCWLVYIALLPLNLTYFLGFPHLMPADLLLPLLAVLSAPLVWRRFPRVAREDWPVLLYLGFFLLAAAVSALRYGISGPAAVAAAAQLMLVALYLLFRCGAAERDFLVRLLAAWVAVSSLVCLAGLGAVALGYCGLETPLARWYPDLGPGAWRLIGTVGHSPNNAYGYLHVGFFFSLGLWLWARQGHSVGAGKREKYPARKMLPAAVGLHAAALLLTCSRGLTGLLLGLIVVAGIIPGAWAGRRALLAKISLWAALVLSLAYGMVFYTYTTDAHFTSSPAAADSLGLDKDRGHLRAYSYKNVLHLEDGARYRRLACGFTYLPSMHGCLLKASWHLFLAQPLAGVGPGRFPDVLDSLRAGGKLGLPPGLPRLRPHSTVMGALAEGGLLGFAGLVVLWWFFLGPRSRRRLKTDPPGLCLYAALAGYLLFALNVDVMNFRWLWLLMAAAAAWRALPGNGGEGGDENKQLLSGNVCGDQKW